MTVNYEEKSEWNRTSQSVHLDDLSSNSGEEVY